MTARWFVSSLRVGAAAATGVRIRDGRAVVEPKVTLERQVEGEDHSTPFPFHGTALDLVGPGDVTGFDRTLVVREEPPAGCTTGVASELACVEFAHADLPWALSPGDAPWLALIVFRDEEGVLNGDVASVTSAALPDLADTVSWAHVEARLPDDAPDPAELIAAGARRLSPEVISRLICPRRLLPETSYLACVVPATAAGVAAGLGLPVTDAQAVQPAWRPGDGTVDLPVYHSWRFATGSAGSFEELARRLSAVDPTELPGFGSREVDLRAPWPQEPGAAGPVTVAMDGALKIPDTDPVGFGPPETWSDPAAQAAFRTTVNARIEGDEDHAVGPPLYGGQHTGLTSVPATGWARELNLEVRRRVAAALGARYVQLEQEFLMARAWEQAGPVREANRLLAVAELAAAAAERAQDKHLASLDPSTLTTLTAPLAAGIEITVGTGTKSFAGALAGTRVPGGVPTTAFHRLSRTGGALARRAARAGASDAPPVIAGGLAGEPCLLPARTGVTAQTTEQWTGRAVPADATGSAATRTMSGLLGGEQSLFDRRQSPDALSGIIATLNDSGPAAHPVLDTRYLRGLRRGGDFTAMDSPGFLDPEATILDPGQVAAELRAGLAPMPGQLGRATGTVSGPTMDERAVDDQRPLRPIMMHPVFTVPMATELLTRWPDWAIPGIAGFPSDSVTLLETNPPFVAALMTGLNQEFNRELLWREYPTDQRGTPFARFWPDPSGTADIDEIARWPRDGVLGTQLSGGGTSMMLLVRGEVLRRYPGTVVLAALPTRDGVLPSAGEAASWRVPRFPLPIDDSTVLYAFADLTPEQARAEGWMFVIREPMRGTRFGFDERKSEVDLPGTQSGWRWCANCHSLAWEAGYGPCNAGGGHDHTASPHFSVAIQQPPEDPATWPPGVQTDWRWCSRCNCLVHVRFGNGICGDAQPHRTADSGLYAVAYQSTPKGVQQGWRWCSRCQGLAFMRGDGACHDGQPHYLNDSGQYGVLMQSPTPPLRTWADLTWDDVPTDGRGFVVPRPVRGLPPTPPVPTGPVWSGDSADVARIAFQRPFQLAVSAEEMLPDGP